MNKLASRLGAKLCAFVLFAVLLTVFAASGVGIIYLIYTDAYIDNGKNLLSTQLESMARSKCYEAIDYYEQLVYEQNDYMIDTYRDKFSGDKSNFFFEITDEQGNQLLSNYFEENYSCKVQITNQFTLPDSKEHEETKNFDDYNTLREYLDALERSYTVSSSSIGSDDSKYILHVEYYENEQIKIFVNGYVRSQLTAKDDFYRNIYWQKRLVSIKNMLIPICIYSFIMAAAMFIFLICGAGRREGDDAIHLNWIDKIPLDLYAAAVFILLLVVSLPLLKNASEGIAFVILAVCLGVFWVMMAASLALTFTARAKYGGWWRNTIIYRMLRFAKQLILWGCRGIRYLYRCVSLFWKVVAVFIGISLLELIFLAAGTSSFAFLMMFWFLEKLLLTPFIIFAVINLQKLKKAGERMAQGELEETVDLSHMFWDFRKHGENLNSINEGMQKAVDERMKSERLKTELITNVSHDIKTPLTSIINYVDLLKKESLSPEKANEYVEVLDRQSARLKKLTEDVVEASKASTGNITVNVEPTDINVILEQTMGEYDERLKKCELELVTDIASEPVVIMADGRLLWRVLDNLMNNICKYAQPQTRVYVSSSVIEGKAEICFKNVSKYPLNISSEELMERFVRGDSSRNTEGSGLGLSIARSLMQLQNGGLEITIDGDLFKIRLSFDI